MRERLGKFELVGCVDMHEPRHRLELVIATYSSKEACERAAIAVSKGHILPPFA
jgi:hypothetical protein